MKREQLILTILLLDLQGLSSRVALSILKESGYKTSLSSVKRALKQIREGTAPFYTEGNTLYRIGNALGLNIPSQTRQYIDRNGNIVGGIDILSEIANIWNDPFLAIAAAIQQQNGGGGGFIGALIRDIYYKEGWYGTDAYERMIEVTEAATDLMMSNEYIELSPVGTIGSP